ncbi:MAG: hypothetical protein JHC33_10775 [Ignisphaera sp.]|nr:hypothetical protein [Ignisphaera sp.]
MEVTQIDTIEVDVYIPQYTICGDDIFIANYSTNPPEWFVSMINETIDNSQLANDVNDLENEFVNFKDGYTNDISYLTTKDAEIVASVETLKVSNDANTAGIHHLDVVKVTASDAQAISENTIAAWSNTTGGAWFTDKVSAVSNVAYSAAKSASNLTAVMNSQQSQLNAIVGDIDVLKEQVDGKVETWFSVNKPVLSDGTIDPNVEPYKTWLANGEVDIHTGDTYIYYQLDAYGNKKILATYRFGIDPHTHVAVWALFEDDLASVAYNAALNAQYTADGKIVTYYQTFPPDASISSSGDLWLDSDDNNKMYRYDGTQWLEVSDQRVQASVQRLDEATVTVDGKAVAKSSLKVDANGIVSGYVASSGTTSEFKIFADKFTIARYDNGQVIGAPFTVDTVSNKIKFTGNVTFSGTVVETALQPGQAASDINSGTTTIDGGKITTGTITTNQISTYGLNANVITSGVMYNTGGNASNYKMMINLDAGEIHIR